MAKRCKKNKVLNFLGVAFLCAVGTAILLLIVAENSGFTFNLVNSDVLSLGANFIGIFVVLLIGFVIYHCRR